MGKDIKRKRSKMKVARVRLYVGPVVVKEVAAKLRAAGTRYILEGTEHVVWDQPYQVARGRDTGILDQEQAVGLAVKAKVFNAGLSWVLHRPDVMDTLEIISLNVGKTHPMSHLVRISG